jgi:glycosyltransferase involved in cell wall biosynthesis
MAHIRVFFQEHPLPSFTLGLAVALSKIGINVDVFTNRLNLRLRRVYGVKMRFTPFSPWTTSAAYPWFLHNVETARPNLYHINMASLALLFVKTRGKHEIPIVYTAHYVRSPEPFEELVPHSDKLFYEKETEYVKLVSENSFRVVSGSEFARSQLKREHGIDSAVIHNGVDLNEFNPNVPQKSVNFAKKLIGAKDDDRIVLWVARFGHHPYKDPFTFIRAIPLVLREHSKTKFIMIGKGPLKPYAVGLASKLRLDGSLTFLDRVQALPPFYAASDIFVLPSFNDTFGNVIAEAMACGRPVVVSDRGSLKEVAGDAGLLFRYGSHFDLAKKILLLLENPKLRAELGLKGYKRIAEKFTWAAAAQKYAAIYEEAIRKNY